MMEHIAYWTDRAAEGIAIVFGPVADPSGGWGVAVVDVTDDDHLRTLITNDPAVISNIGMRYETLFMPQAIVGARRLVDNKLD